MDSSSNRLNYESQPQRFSEHYELAQSHQFDLKNEKRALSSGGFCKPEICQLDDGLISKQSLEDDRCKKLQINYNRFLLIAQQLEMKNPIDAKMCKRVNRFDNKSAICTTNEKKLDDELKEYQIEAGFSSFQMNKSNPEKWEMVSELDMSVSSFKHSQTQLKPTFNNNPFKTSTELYNQLFTDLQSNATKKTKLVKPSVSFAESFLLPQIEQQLLSSQNQTQQLTYLEDIIIFSTILVGIKNDLQNLFLLVFYAWINFGKIEKSTMETMKLVLVMLLSRKQNELFLIPMVISFSLSMRVPTSRVLYQRASLLLIYVIFSTHISCILMMALALVLISLQKPKRQKVGCHEENIFQIEIAPSKVQKCIPEEQVVPKKLNERIQNYMIEQMSNGLLVCKIQRTTYLQPRNSDQIQGENYSLQQQDPLKLVEFGSHESTIKKRRKISNSCMAKKLYLEPVQDATHFFQSLPLFEDLSNLNRKKKNTRLASVLQGTSHQILQIRSNTSSRPDSYESEQKLTTNLESNFELSDFEEELLQLKIYQPYFISHSTIVHFHSNSRRKKDKSSEKLSLMDILESHLQSKHTHSKLYFKVNLQLDLESFHANSAYDQELLNSFPESSCKNIRPIPPNQMSEIQELSSSNSQNSLCGVKKNRENSGKCIQRNNFEEIERPKWRFTGVENSQSYEQKEDEKSEGSSRTNPWYQSNQSGEYEVGDKIDSIRYYEIEIKQVKEFKEKEGEQELTMIQIRDISMLVKNQQKQCDMIYQDAIENNFSHEQMTPLNPILNQSVMIKQKLVQICLEKLKRESQSDISSNVEGIYQTDLQYVMQHSKDAKMIIGQIASIEQAAKLIWYYNTNQIKRMKIKKNQLHVQPLPIENIDQTIYEVLWPFEHFVHKRRHNVYIVKKLIQGHKMVADWKLYELVLFNIVQNAVKYNRNNDGDIVIVLTLKPKKKSLDEYNEGTTYILDTCVIDSGIGISKERQKLLFIPFLELKDKIGINKSENDNIGIGLACSKAICRHMGGDIRVRQSQKGMTSIQFRIPVKIEQLSNFGLNKQEISSGIERIMGNIRIIPVAILNLLMKMKAIKSKQNLKIKEIMNYENQKVGFQQIDKLSCSNLENSNKSQSKMSRNSIIAQNQKQIFQIKGPKNKKKKQLKSSQYLRDFPCFLLQQQNNELKSKTLMSQARKSSFEKRSVKLNSINRGLSYDSRKSSNENYKKQSSLSKKNSDKQEEVKKSSRIVFLSSSSQSKNSSNSLSFEIESENNYRKPSSKSNVLLSKSNHNEKILRPLKLNDVVQYRGSHTVKIPQILHKNHGDLISNIMEMQAKQVQITDQKLKKQVMNNIMINNHKNKLNIILKDYKLQQQQSLEPENNSNEEIDDILIDEHSGLVNDVEYKVKIIRNNSQSGEIMPIIQRDSMDCILLQPRQIKDSNEIKPSSTEQSSHQQVQLDAELLQGPYKLYTIQDDKESISEKSEQSINELEQSSSSQDSSSGESISGISRSQSMSQGIDSFKIPESQSLKEIQYRSDNVCGTTCEPKILVVDDNDFNSMTLSIMISNMTGNKPTEATNGVLAVSKYKTLYDKACGCKNRAFKLIFMDIQMPVMDGYEATKQILAMCDNELRKHKTIPGESSFCNIVALTSYTSKEVEEKCIKIGMKKVIPKPINAKQLQEVIQLYYN